ncbi:MAG TPA: TIGR03086 family metal-binding protein, partial [Rugosimonospora sp.]|nr:TIGR03086 family metal-binding protein [Rugosimonospora sp.]
RTVLPGRLRELAEAWRAPAAWEGMADAGGVTMPAEVMGVVALDEVVLHGWDLARGTGQKYGCDPASAAAVLEFTRNAARPDNAPLRAGLFGPVVAVPEDAPAFERALGYAGRDPAWQAPPRGGR